MNITKGIIAVALFGFASFSVSQTTFTGTTAIDTSSWIHQKTVGASTVIEKFGKIASYTHADGTNDNQMSDVIIVSGTLTNSQSVTHSLAAMSNSFGDSINFSTVKTLAVTASGGDLAIGNAASDQFSAWLGDTNQTAKVASGGILVFVAPLTGWTSTNKLLKIENTTTNTATYQLYIGGTQ